MRVYLCCPLSVPLLLGLTADGSTASFFTAALPPPVPPPLKARCKSIMTSCCPHKKPPVVTPICARVRKDVKVSDSKSNNASPGGNRWLLRSFGLSRQQACQSTGVARLQKHLYHGCWKSLPLTRQFIVLPFLLHNFCTGLKCEVDCCYFARV